MSKCTNKIILYLQFFIPLCSAPNLRSFPGLTFVVVVRESSSCRQKHKQQLQLQRKALSLSCGQVPPRPFASFLPLEPSFLRFQQEFPRTKSKSISEWRSSSVLFVVGLVGFLVLASRFVCRLLGKGMGVCVWVCARCAAILTVIIKGTEHPEQSFQSRATLQSDSVRP